MLQSHGHQPTCLAPSTSTSTSTSHSIPLSLIAPSDYQTQLHASNHASPLFTSTTSLLIPSPTVASSALTTDPQSPNSVPASGSRAMTTTPNSDSQEHNFVFSTSSTMPPPVPADSRQFRRNPSPLAIPELLQQICIYLDTKALVHACQVSRSFHVCCEPLLWTDVPECAWSNPFFGANWTLHADKIRFLACGPGVDLKFVAKHCRGLISLDVSKIMERGVMGQSPVGDPSNNSLGIDGRGENYKDHVRAGSISKSGTRNPFVGAWNRRSSIHNNNTKSIRAAENINKSHQITKSGTVACTTLRDKNDIAAHNSTGRNSAVYTTFHEMADCLVVLLQQNPRLRCLRLRPYGMIPRPLLSALSQLADLRLLFLNSWQDFQEYSLQLILESCRSLEHLSLGENDFTRFTLKSMVLTSVSSRYQQHLKQTGTEKVLRLEKFDDPLKSTSGLTPQTGQTYVEPDLRDFHAKRGVLVSSSTLGSEGALAYELHLQQLSQQSGAVHLDPLSYNQQGIYTSSTLAHRPDHSLPVSHKQQQEQQRQQQTQIRSLNLDHTGLRQEFLLNLANQCPKLEHLSVQASWGLYPSSKFMQLIRFTCPELKRFQFRDQGKDLQDEFFLQMIDQFSGQLEWLHAGKTGFSQAGLAALLRQQSQLQSYQDSVLLQGQPTQLFRGLVSLNVDGARGIQSKSVVQLLEQCSGLKVLSAQGVVLNGRDLFQSPSGLVPWSCRGLETLMVDIEIYASATTTPRPPTVETVRCEVYRQLGRLTRLRHLGLGGGHCIRGPKNELGVDLTLDSGLDALSGLHCLEYLDVHRLVQHIRQAELAWMVHHWPRLRKIEAKKDISRSVYTQPSSSPLGQLFGASNDRSAVSNGPEGSMNKAIEWLAQARPGIDICLI